MVRPAQCVRAFLLDFFQYDEDVKNTIENLIKEALIKVGAPAVDFTVEHPDNLSYGDYSTNVALRVMGPIYHGKRDTPYEKGVSMTMWQAGVNEFKNPFDLAQKLAEVLGSIEGVEKIEAVKPGFINFYLTKEFFKKSLGEIIEAENDFGQNTALKGKKFFIEHTQPNPFKKFHIGHLMNNAIGESLVRVIKANGAEVKTATYHGDKGMHVAKALWKGDYAVGAKAFEEDETAKAEIKEINKKIYDQSDAELNKKYEEGRKKSLEDFEKMYARLGSSFDFHFYESEVADEGKRLVQENIGKVFEESDGAVVFKGEAFGLHTRVFLSSEGLPTYEAKELGLAELKKEKFAYDESVTITASEQDAFFKVVEVAIGQVFPELKGKLKHFSHGMLRLPTGKMSSRTGDVITAEDLIESVKEKVKNDEAVAIGAIKYMILRQSIGNDIVFDIDKSVSTEGDSGVYLQYAYARTNSLLEKAGVKGDASGERKETHEVEKLLYRFPEIVERAGMDYSPNTVVTYLTELAGSFNNFYAHEQVISDDAESSYRIAIVEAFRIVMRNGLNILGIPAPEKM